MNNLEWELHYNNEVVGYLSEPIDVDGFWYRCKVMPKSGCESIVFDVNNWDENKFKYFNISRQEFAVISMPGDFENIANSHEINLRRLYFFEEDKKRVKMIDVYIPICMLILTLIFVVVYSYIKFS